MEILLLSDLPGIGKKNDLIIVGNGYALNHLLPARKAIVVTPNVRRRYAEQIKKRALERELEKTAQSSSLKVLAGKSLQFMQKASKAGKLYAAISEKMIADNLKNQFGINLAPEQIKVKEPIKNIGVYTISLQIGDQTTPVSVEVKSDMKTAEKKSEKKKVA
ncbi:MAG: 50S ribosomal protein L9 [Candidatus Peribacteraceae bacterium]|nr:50S ribosomal protein L9 [Candidatus Peribacteraceae bacterium]